MRRQVHFEKASSRGRKQFGSFGSLATQHVKPLKLESLGYSRNGVRRPTSLYKNNKWNKVRMTVKEDDVLTFHYKMSGSPSESTFLFAVFPESRIVTTRQGKKPGVVHQFLFIRPISPSNGFALRSTFSVAAPTNIRDIVFYVSEKLPVDVASDYMKSDSKRLLGNPQLRRGPSPNAFRSPTFGFAPYDPVIKGVTSGDWDGDGSFETWDGDVSEHRWVKYGWSSEMQSETVASPKVVGAGDPYVAVKSSIYVYKNTAGRTGWEPIQINGELPAGIPLMLIVQAFFHDQHHAVGDFAQEWHYDEDTIPANRIWFGPWIPQAVGSGFTSRDTGYPVTQPSWYRPGANGLLSYGVPPGPAISLGNNFDSSLFITESGSKYQSTRSTRQTTDLRHFGYKVEWWDDSAKTWTTPSIHPPKALNMNGAGKAGLVFRFPRQVQPADAPIDSWNIDNSKDYYPVLIPHQGKYKVKFGVLGRTEVLMEDGTMGYVNQGDMLAMKSVPFHCYMSPSNSTFWGPINAEEQVLGSEQFKFAIADPVTYARVNNPELCNIYWKEGEFAPGSKMIVIGQALNAGMSMCVTLDDNEKPSHTRENRGSTGDILAVDYSMTTEQLLDGTSPTVESRVRSEWKDMFGTELTSTWFATIGKSGLKNQNATNPMNYDVIHEGQKYEFPYTISVITIPSDWVGPKVDFVQGEGGAMELSSESIEASTRVYFTAETEFKQFMTQELILREEIAQQIQMQNEGLRADETLATNVTDTDAYNATSELIGEDIAKARQELEAAKDNKDKDGGLLNFWPFKRRKLETDSYIRSKTLLPVGDVREVKEEEGLGNITFNTNDMEVTDVTDKYSADHVTSLGGWSNLGGSDKRGASFANFDFDEAFIIQGQPTGASVDWFMGIEPEPAPIERVAFGQHNNADSKMLHARATKRGNPVDVTTINGVRQRFQEGA